MRMFFNDKDDVYVKVLIEVIPVQINKLMMKKMLYSLIKLIQPIHFMFQMKYM